jgi:hypothetical protein
MLTSERATASSGRSLSDCRRWSARPRSATRPRARIHQARRRLFRPRPTRHRPRDRLLAATASSTLSARSALGKTPSRPKRHRDSARSERNHRSRVPKDLARSVGVVVARTARSGRLQVSTLVPSLTRDRPARGARFRARVRDELDMNARSARGQARPSTPADARQTARAIASELEDPRI